MCLRKDETALLRGNEQVPATTIVRLVWRLQQHNATGIRSISAESIVSVYLELRALTYPAPPRRDTSSSSSIDFDMADSDAQIRKKTMATKM